MKEVDLICLVSMLLNFGGRSLFYDNAERLKPVVSAAGMM